MQTAKISYRHVDEFPGFMQEREYLRQRIAQYRPRTVLEVGAGPNPTLRAEDLTDLRYITTDRSAEELMKAPAGFETRVLDLESDSQPADLQGRCDLVFSRLVNEHVKHPRKYHSNIRRLLAPNGIAIHCFSCLYSLPFLTNKLMPSAISDKVLYYFDPRDRVKQGKFPAYYAWSRGPTAATIRRFEEIGYVVEAYNGYFGHNYYKSLPLLNRLEAWKSKALLGRPVPLLCSYGEVVLRRDQ